MTRRLLLLLAIVAAIALPSFSLENLKGYYWIDDGDPIEFVQGLDEISVAELTDGFHTLAITLTHGDNVATPLSTSFVKIPAINTFSGILSIDGVVYNDYTLSMTGANAFSCVIDLEGVRPGFHSLEFVGYTTTGSVADSYSAWFYRAPRDEEMSNALIVYFVDGEYVGTQKIDRNGNAFLTEIDFTALETGFHSLDVFHQLADGSSTSAVHGWFYRAPIPAGVASYDYWFEGDYANMRHIPLNDVSTTLGILDMIEVPQLNAFDSRMYTFTLQDDKPVIYPLYTMTMQFNEVDGHTLTRQTVFQETREPMPVEKLETLNDGVNKVDTHALNEIKWFTFEGEIGDSIVISMNSKAMYELYAPSGTEVLRRKNVLTREETSYTLLENGTYYLAAHDVTDNRTAGFDVNFQHIPRNAILSVTPGTTTTSMAFTPIEIVGNGFRNAKKAIITGSNGYTHEIYEVFAFDNNRLLVLIDESLEVGAYSLSIVYDDIDGSEAIVEKQNVLFVNDNSAKSNVVVSVVPSKKASTPYMVNINITNDSDVPCWGIPFNVACERNHGKNGFALYLKDLFTDYEAVISNMKWYETENLLGSGVDGIIFPFILDYLKPHETRTMRVGIYSEPHARVGLYAWGGKPYNEEMAELLAMPTDSLQQLEFYQSNLLDFKSLLYLTALYYENNQKNETASTSQYTFKAPSAPQRPNVLEWLREYGPDAVGHLPGMENSSSLANHLGHISVAAGQTIGSIINTGPCRDSYERLKDAGIPGNNLLEQLDNFYKMYPNQREDGQWKHIIDQAERNLERLVPPEDILREALGGVDGADEAMDLIEWFLGNGCESANPNPDRHDIFSMQSGDPNDLLGYTDPSGSNFVGLDVKELDYTIEFENDPDIANAPATRIVVTNTLDGNVFDLTSFAPKSISIGKHNIELPSKHNFVVTQDMRPDINCIAEIGLDYSILTGKSVWTFNSLDPITLEPTEIYTQGLLPVNNDAREGEGTISYSVELKPSLTHSTQIDNQATIIFDDNDPIDTPTWTNVTDYERPTSSIAEEHGYADGAYTFSIEGTDLGSGILKYDLYGRLSDSNEWIVLKPSITDNYFAFEIDKPIDNIEFKVLATDRAGNRELDKVVRLGDLDSNGVVDAVDVVLLYRYYIDNSMSIERKAADLNKDGLIDAQDAVAIQRLYVSSAMSPQRARAPKFIIN